MNKLILSVIIQIIILINVNTSNCISSSEIDSLKKAVKEVKGDVKDIDRSLRSEIKDSKEKLLEGIFQNQIKITLLNSINFFIIRIR
jgi:hypothetical protein